MNTLINLLLSLPPLLVLGAALLLPAIEASALVGLVVPGETAVFVAGMTAHAGHLSLPAVVGAAAIGAVVGDQVGFALGRRWGPLLQRRLPGRLVGSGRVDRVADFVRRRGAWAVLLGRWTAVLRALVPGLAGTSGMSRRTFTVFNVLGGVSWALGVAVLGFGAGAAYDQVLHTMGRVGTMTVLGGLAVAATVAVVRRRGRSRTTATVPR